MKRKKFHYPTESVHEKPDQAIDRTKTQNSIDKTENIDKKRLKNKYKCSLCNYTSSTKSNLTKHILGIHERRKPYICDLCEYKTYFSSNLLRHVHSVHEESKSFTCHICEYRCSAKAILMAHILSVHEKKKPFKCTVCEINFLKDLSCLNMSYLFMKGKDHISVIFAKENF